MTERKVLPQAPIRRSLTTANLQSVVVGDSATTANFQTVANKVPAATAPKPSAISTSTQNLPPKK